MKIQIGKMNASLNDTKCVIDRIQTVFSNLGRVGVEVGERHLGPETLTLYPSLSHPFLSSGRDEMAKPAMCD